MLAHRTLRVASAAVLFAFGSTLAARAGDRPRLSMAGTTPAYDAAGPSEAEVRQEIIRRLEARILSRQADRRSAPAPLPLAASPVEEVDLPRALPSRPVAAPRPLGYVPPDLLAEGMPLPPEATRRAVGLPPSSTPAAPPRAASAPAAAPGIVSHVLQPKDTLWALARRYRTTVFAIEQANRIQSPTDLSMGRILVIPPPGAPGGAAPGAGLSAQAPSFPVGPGGSYTVAAKDTLFKIAKGQQVTVDELIRANPDLGTKVLSPGMKVRIPSGRGPAQVPIAWAPPSSPAPSADPAPTRPGPPALLRSGTLNMPRPPAPPAPAARAAASTAGDSPSFQWPIQGTVTANFGWKEGKPHTGLDISAPQGTAIKAAAAGKVIYADPMRDYGNVVILDHENGFFTVYGHNQENLVSKRNPRVAAGQVIARVGATGDAAAPQVHFEVRRLNQAVDPTRYMAPMGGMAAVR